MKKNIILILFLLSLCAALFGQMQTISIPDGLSSPNVYNLYQDRFGYMWIMTEDGLNRYDGNTIKVFRNDPDNPNSLFSNSVFSAVEDQEGFLWIGGVGIASRYNYATETFEVFNFNSVDASERGQHIISLFTDSKGRIWAGSFGGIVYRFNKETSSFDLIHHVVDTDINYTGEIWDITQLKNGTLLFANTKRGIFQFDESIDKLTNYLLAKDFSPKLIYRIQEDDDGTIWFSGYEKVVHYNPSFYSYEILEDLNIIPKLYHNGYYKISDENYLFISEPFGIISYNPKTSKVIGKIQSQLKAPFWFISDKYGIVWIAANGGVNKYDPNAMPFGHVQLTTSNNQEIRDNTIHNIILDNSEKENIWATAVGNKLINYNLQSGEIEQTILNLPEQFQNREIFNMVQAKSGEMYLSIRNGLGLIKYDPAKNKITTMRNIKTAFHNDFRTNDLEIDQKNNLFIASTRGLLYFDLNEEKEIIIPSISNRLYSDKFTNHINKVLNNGEELAIIKEANESKEYNIEFILKNETPVLIRCMGEGILGSGSQNMFDFGTLSSSDGKVIYSMQDYYNTFHAGGGRKNRTEYKLLKLDPGSYSLKYEMDAGHSFPLFNDEMPSDSAFYGIQIYKISENGFSALKKELDESLNDPSCLPMGNASDVLISKKYGNSVYIASASEGLFRYNILAKSFTHYTFGDIENANQKNIVSHSYEDISGNIWVSTASGLIFLNPENGNWRVFTEKDGLPSNTILKTIEDKNGDLWIVSLGGLSKFNKSDAPDKWNFINYDTRDGISGYSFNGDPILTPDGEILFVVSDDLHRFTPRTSNTVKPDIIISDMRISDISIFEKDAPLKLDKSLMEIGTITLPYNLNDLSFSFNVAHYARTYKNRVFYKLVGFNKKWVEPELGSATFTNLEPGSYEFKVRGISADGIRNDEGTSIKIEISPPWWRTYWAYAGYVFILGLLIFGFDRMQRRKLIAKSKEKMKIQEAEHRAEAAELQARAIHAEHERKTKELEEARQLQLSMLPKELPQLPNLDIAVYMQTATEVGGDYYDFHVGLDGTLTVVIGDATGHGMKAGTMVTATKSLFRSYAANPDILFSFKEFTRCIKEMNFGKTAMCLTMLKIKGDKMQMSTAAMPPSFIFRRSTRVVEEHLFEAMPLGTMKSFPYEIKETTLKSGDTILLMSDGLPELLNDKEEMYGYQKTRNGFEDVAEKSPEKIINFLKEEGRNWNNNQAPDDDVTFVVIKVK